MCIIKEKKESSPYNEITDCRTFEFDKIKEFSLNDKQFVAKILAVDKNNFNSFSNLEELDLR